jgi:signal transduction histidine kinase/streptogramin lyase
MATGGGVNKYDPSSNQFELFALEQGLSNVNVVSLTLHNHHVLAGMYGGGVDVLNTETNSIKSLEEEAGMALDEHVLNVFKGSDGLIWIATEKQGLWCYNPFDNTHEHYTSKEGQYSFWENSFPVCITEDKRKRVWVSTDKGGLYCFDKTNKSFINLRNNPVVSESLKSNALTKILIDDSNLLWVGTYDKGVCYSNLEQENIVHVTHQANHLSSLSDRSVNCIYEDSDGDIWIGTENGLNKADKKFNINKKLYRSNGMSDDVCLSILETRDGELWIGSYTGGISIYNKKTDAFRYLKKPEDSNEEGLSSDFVRALYQDSEGLIWIGTVRGGLDKYDPKTGAISHYPNTHNERRYLNSSNVLSLLEDEQHNLWIATYGGGVNVFNRASGSFSYYENDKNKPNSLSSDQVTSQLMDSNGDYWVGTNFGLNRLNEDHETFTIYYVEDGLASNSIVGLIEDNHKNLWITTQNGLSIYNIDTGMFSNFFKEDGLQENVFHYNAITKLRNGSVVCGGINGLNVFEPNITVERRAPQPVIITGLSIFNNQVSFGRLPDGREVFEGKLSEAQSINLSYKDKLFELSYSTLEYRNPKQTNFQYKIDELHNKWISLGNENTISFHNLRPGDYTFRIKSTTLNSELESNETVLMIIIQPPFYGTVWFFLLIGIVLVTSVVAIYFIKNRNARIKRKILEQTVAEKTKELSLAYEKLEKHKDSLELIVSERTKDLRQAKEKAEQADALKTAFLANMSHEIRTPMNAILGFVDLLINAEVSDEESIYFKELIQSNGVTLMRLIDDIMDLARIESGDFQIKKSWFDIREEVEKITSNYLDGNCGLQPGVSFVYNKLEHPLQVYTDRIRLRQVITNLINNAIKFTELGWIKFNYTIDGGRMYGYVQDTGIGIPAHEIDNIFNRFNKLEGYSEKVYRGTGLGLAITKELIKQLGGSINVESEKGKGSTFYFNIKIDND